MSARITVLERTERLTLWRNTITCVKGYEWTCGDFVSSHPCLQINASRGLWIAKPAHLHGLERWKQRFSWSTCFTGGWIGVVGGNGSDSIGDWLIWESWIHEYVETSFPAIRIPESDVVVGKVDVLDDNVEKWIYLYSLNLVGSAWHLYWVLVGLGKQLVWAEWLGTSLLLSLYDSYDYCSQAHAFWLLLSTS